MPAGASASIKDSAARAAIAFLALLSAYLLARGAALFPLDDAYIHLTFARNLARLGSFSFNPGEFSLGFSSPLWVGLIAALAKIGAEPPAAARALGYLAFTFAAAAVFDLARMSARKLFSDGDASAIRRARIIAIMTAAGIALSGNLAWLAGSGMEAMLFLALGLFAIAAFAAQRRMVTMVLLGLLLLTRPTGLVLALLLFGLAAARKDRGMAMAVFCSLLPLAAWSLYSHAATGYFLPPTRAGKLASNLVNSGPAPAAIARFLYQHLVYFSRVSPELLWLMVFSIAASAGFAASARRARTRAGETALHNPALIVILWASLHLLAHAVFFRSTAIFTPYHNLRYQPALPVALWLSAALAASWLVFHKPRFAKAAMGALFIAAVIAASIWPRWHRLYHDQSRRLQKVHLAAAEWARTALPENVRLGSLDVGILGYYSGRHILDLGGLTDTSVIPFLQDRRTGPWLAANGFTHYFALRRHDSERITGVEADAGRIYRLKPLRLFETPGFPEPVFLHSFAMEAFEAGPTDTE